MATLCIRNVPPEVVRTLEQRAASAGVSLNDYLVGQLTRLAQCPTNPDVVEQLRSSDRSTGPETAEIMELIRANRR